MKKFKKIDSKDIEDIIALTPLQEGMLFHYLREPWSDFYFEQLSLEISGEIDLEYFEKSWNLVIEINEMLRTAFRWEKLEYPIQVILKKHNIHPRYVDFSDKKIKERNKHLEEIKMKDRKEKFDLREVPFRVTLCRIDNERYEMIISNHHILYDGWSNGIILREFFETYDGICKRSPLMPTAKAKFKEFVKWSQSRVRASQEKFWRNYLKGFDIQTELAVKSKRKEQGITITGTETHPMKFEKNATDKLEAFVKKHKITLASLLYTAWGLLLQRYNNTHDVIFGTTVSGRSAGVKGIEHMVGLFINTLPLRIQTNSNEKTIDLLYRIDNDLKIREGYESTSLVDIKKYSEFLNNEELFDSIVIVENYPVGGRFMLQNSSLVVKSYSIVEQSHYDLTVGITAFEDIKLLFQYNKSMLAGDMIRRMGHHLKRLIKDITTNPAKLTIDHEIMSWEEKKQLLDEFNGTPLDFPKDKTVVHLFEEQVKRVPDRISIVGSWQLAVSRVRHTHPIRENMYISYKELNERTNLLAGVLKGKGVLINPIIGIVVQRSLEMVSGILAILKAGRAYLPIDPEYPDERITYMLTDSRVTALVTTRPLTEEGDKMRKWEGEKIFMSTEPIDKTARKPSPIHPLTPSPNQPGYVIYTSGSTGKPKGVMVEHGSVVNLLFALHHRYPLKQQDTYLLKTSYLFDVSVTELFGWILQGGRLAVLEKDGEKDPEKILDTIELEEVTHINFVPSMFNVFTMALTHDNKDKLSSLKYIFLAGEALLPESVKRFRFLNTTISLENIYGPTEAAVYSSGYSLAEWSGRDRVPIGKPLANVKLYIVNGYGDLQPIGVPGELCISGAGVARGYLNNPELTAQKFCLRRPGGTLFEKTAPPGPPCKNFLLFSPIYLTGDWAWWLSDGNIEFLGRMDHQVKIRGFRVELGEIENQLLKHEAIQETIVIARQDGSRGASINPGDNYLCSYIVLHSPHSTYSPQSLREYLSNVLPDYMIPSYFVRIDGIPLTPSGKLDRKALPAPVITGEKKYTAPRNHIEQELIEIWSEVLSSDAGYLKIGIDDNFFELGGHSLKATILISKIHKKLDVKVPFMEVFKRKTIRKLSEYIQDAIQTQYDTIEPLEKKEYYALSSAQKRLFFLQQMDLDSTSYNMMLVLPLGNVGNNIDKDKLEFLLKKLTARHESLRTSFEIVNDEPVQRIHNDVAFEMEDYCAKRKAQSAERKEEPYAPCAVRDASTLKNFIRPFDLSKAPLIRSGLSWLPDGNHLWIVDMHHIISDGTSGIILAEEFISLCNGEELEPLRLRYKDFSHWQNRLFASGEIRAQEEYWLDLYADAGEIPRLRLPIDFKRPEVFTFEGHRYMFRLDREDAVKFRTLGFQYGGTLYMAILSALDVLFYTYTGQSDIIIGSGIAGRRHDDLQGIIGMFVNTLAMRNYPDREKTYESFLKEVIANSIKAFENQDMQFEELVDRLDLERNPSRNPIFDISMVVQNFRKTGEGQEKGKNSGQAENLFALDYKNNTSKFDMTFFISEHGEDVSVMIEYYTGILREETVKRMARHLENVIKAVIKDPYARLKDIDIISQEEKHLVLYDFNAASRDYPMDKLIHERFEEQVQKIPCNTALVFEDLAITYKELDERANQLAWYLFYDKCIQPEARVGILLDKGIETIVALMGTLKAGGAYVPMESSFPPERKKHIIIDSHIGIVLSEKKHIRDLNQLQWECDCFHSYLCMDSDNVYEEEEVEKNELMNRELWEHVGETAEDEIAGGGWVSSYTGQPMSKQEMDEYGNNILKKLTPLLHGNMRVLEIGTASGISMYRIAPKVGLYYGTDLSSVIIEKNKKRVEEEGYRNIKLACLAAHEINKIEERDFDLIIMNSVIQCFHGHHYLRKVIEQAIDLLGESRPGYLFIGDIMDQDLKDALVADMIAFRQANRDKNYTIKTDFSAELFVSREFWEDLAAEFEVIDNIEFSVKICTIKNELTKYRYDALITINKDPCSREKRLKQKHKYQEDIGALRAVVGILPSPVSSHHLAYVIYTSGTTGQPKGVIVEHYQVNNCLYWMQEKFRLKGPDVVLQRTNLTFDPSVWEVFWPLVIGAQIKVIHPDQRKDPEFLTDLVAKNENRGITLMYCPASLLTGMAYLLTSGVRKQKLKLPYLVIGAEPIRMEVVKEFYKFFQGMLVNTYGPTEGTINNTYYDLAPDDPRSVVPIGKPVANNTIYIFSLNMRVVPVFTAGEIYIGGDSVARGYLNQPGLTSERFIEIEVEVEGEREAHELYELHEKNNKKLLRGVQGGGFLEKSPPGRRRQKIYKTGDMGRWLVDGNVEFIGRVDQQVKIRGYRIELEEIENWLLEHNRIKVAVVVLHNLKQPKDPINEKFLCAYIVPDGPDPGGSSIDAGELRDYLSRFLPDYMIPSHFVHIPRVPLAPGGKLDRKALPVPDYGAAAGKNHVPPRDQLEKRLVDVWSEVLGRWGKASIGIDNNFFELGGHSLKATMLTAKIHKELNVKVPLAEIFKRQTIRGLAGYIRDAEEDRFASIEPVEKKEYYSLSSAQKRLYVLQQIDEHGVGYNMPSVWRMEGNLDPEKFAAVFHQLLQRHESLGTAFILVKNEPVQRIQDQVGFEIQYNDLKEIKVEEKHLEGTRGLAPLSVSALSSQHSAAGIIKNFIRPFNLSQAPLLRVGLIKMNEQMHILMLDIHHIISDGSSINVLVKDFIALHKRKNLPNLRIQYKGFSEWQTSSRQRELIKPQEAYWLKQFDGELPVLNLPIDYYRPLVQTFEGSTSHFEIHEQQKCSLRSLASDEGATLFIVLLSIFTVFLSKLSGQEDIVVGTPVAGRRHADLEPIIGMFVNTLALRNFPIGEKTFIQFLKEVKKRTLTAFENQDYPYDDLVEQVEVERDTSRNPLFDTMFAVQNMDALEIEIPGLKIMPYNYETRTAKFDLMLSVVEAEEKILLTFEYCTKLFKEETIKRLIGYFRKTISTVIEDYEIKLSEIEIIIEEEKNQILYEFNDTYGEYSRGKMIHQLFEEQVDRKPDTIAITALVPERQAVTYRELNKKSDHLAHLLLKRGIKLDSIVPIMLERSIDMMVGIFGILKAGAGYLPIEPGYPQERIKYILKDSNVRLLLTLKPPGDILGNLNEILDLRDIDYKKNPGKYKILNIPTGIAYVTYTSGSTGKPKGVMVKHQSLLNVLLALFERYPFSKVDTYLLKTSYVFDVSVTELFGWLIGAGRLVLIESGGEKDPQMILDTIANDYITHINFVPSMFNAFLSILNRQNISKLTHLKYIFLAGEAPGKELVEMFNGFKTNVVLENLYGPTEATVYASGYALQDWNSHDPIPIGKPLKNVMLYILDKFDHLLPIGIPGELCISGEGIARGYLNQQELTAEKFCLRRPGGRRMALGAWRTEPIVLSALRPALRALRTIPRKNFLLILKGTGKNHMQSCNLAAMQPYSHVTMQFSPNHSPQYPITPSPHSPIYRTGDLARWRQDGNIEFIGRLDQQVKIRGFRVELGEIENQLLSHKKIKEALVVVKEDERRDKYLAAFFISNSKIEINQLREYLLKVLPGYMIPAYFMQIKKMPLTPNGKINRKALPEPGLPSETGNFAAPRDRIEEKLAEIWSEVLGIPKSAIGIDSNFFYLGGHSLKATLLVSNIHKEFNVKIPLAEIFKIHTIRGLAEFIKGAAEHKFLSIKFAEKKEYYALSSAQERLFILNRMEGIKTAYNLPTALRIKGKLNKNDFENVFLELIKRHESLRTSFELRGEKPVQVVHKDVHFEMKYIMTAENDVKDIVERFIEPFELGKAPLLRVCVVGLTEEEHLLLFDMHHIISDGVSIGILIGEFVDIYEGNELPELRIQYKDFAQWQQKLFNSPALKKQEAYWLERFNPKPPALNLPTDYPRPLIQRFEGDRIKFRLEKELCEKLKRMSEKTDTTLYMILLAAFNVLLLEYTEQEDIVVGCPISGRNHADLGNIIGMFVNMTAVRNFPQWGITFGEFLEEVKENALKAYENQDYPLEELVNKSGVSNDFKQNPLFSVIFVHEDIDISELEVKGLRFIPYDVENKISHMDLVLYYSEVDGVLTMGLEYSTALFKPPGVEDMVKHFIEILNQVVENRWVQLKDIKISHDLLVPESTILEEDRGDFGFDPGEI